MRLRSAVLACVFGIVCSQSVKADPIVSEIRGGALAHDVGFFGSHKEEGADINAEILFSSPGFLKYIWAPRPHIGATYNLWGQTSQVYTGITWNYNFTKHIFGEFSFGPSLNNGHKDKSQENWKDLGFPILFRESLSLGIQFTRHSDVSIFLDHISNAGFASFNGGMETVGVRYGYRF